MEFRHELVLPNEDLSFRLFLFEGKDGNYKVAKHWHHSVEIFLVLTGRIDFYINSAHFVLRENDFVFVNSNEIHSIDSPKPNTTIVLQIPMEAFSGYRQEEPYTNFVKRNPEQNDELAGLVAQMYDVYENRDYGYRLKVQGMFYELLYRLVTVFQEDADREIVRQKRHLDRLAEVTAYLKENYGEELRLEMVARRFGFTPSYLSRMFRRYADVNYKTYLTDLRVEYAVRELLNTDHEIGAIAMNHGFPDSRAFAKAFRVRYGCLPSRYRKAVETESAKKCY